MSFLTASGVHMVGVFPGCDFTTGHERQPSINSFWKAMMIALLRNQTQKIIVHSLLYIVFYFRDAAGHNQQNSEGSSAMTWGWNVDQHLIWL